MRTVHTALVTMARLGVVALLLTGPALAGCAGSAPDTGPTTPGPSAGQGLIVPVSVTRSGGFAGVRQTIEVAADGSWVYTDGRANTTSRGTLTSAQLTHLGQLLTTGGLAEKLSHRSPTPGACNDVFVYTITFGTADTFGYSDCGQPPIAEVNAMLTALSEATPF